jgi:hypothetical protein
VGPIARRADFDVDAGEHRRHRRTCQLRRAAESLSGGTLAPNSAVFGEFRRLHL